MSPSQDQGDVEQILTRAQVRLDIEKPHVDTIRNHDLLVNLKKFGLPQHGWKDYGAERYLSAQPFLPLLRKSISYAKNEIGDNNLASVLQDNLDDEIGVNSPSEGSHEEWRQDFYKAIGVDARFLGNASRSPEGEEYARALLDVGKSPYQAIGAIHYLEVTIPFEFNAILIACEKSFPERFKLNASDTGDIAAEKNKARRYLYDHIVHDMKEHFFDLKRALAHHLAIPKSRQELLDGMSIVAEAKISHMDALTDRLFWS